MILIIPWLWITVKCNAYVKQPVVHSMYNPPTQCNCDLAQRLANDGFLQVEKTIRLVTIYLNLKANPNRLL